MNLPGRDGQPFTYPAAVFGDNAVRVIFGRGSLAQVPSEGAQPRHPGHDHFWSPRS